MSKLRLIPYALLTTGSLLVGGGAYAQSMYSIDQREAQQQQRIFDGIRDGSLTRGEAARLERGEQRIERYEARARADGVVTPAERQRLDRMLDQESRDIHRERTDNQRAWGGGESRGWNHTGYERDGWNQGHHYGWDRGEHAGWGGNHAQGFERRDSYQQNRIYNGVRDGHITRGEFNHLENGEARINRAEARARADGVMTSAERNHINSMQNREGREISRDLNNNRVPSSGTSGSMAGGTHNWGNGNGWQHQQPATGGTTTASGATPHNWGGQAGAASRNSSGQIRTVSNTTPTPARSYGGGGATRSSGAHRY